MIVSVVIRALGVTLTRLKDWLRRLDVKSSLELFQKAALLGKSAKSIRQFLETCVCWVQLALYEIYQNYQLN